MDKKLKKLVDKKCYFCGNDNYEVLDVHRIIPGSKNGKYKTGNVLTVCANCHRKIHAEKIIIEGRHFTTAGVFVLHYFEDGLEYWK